MNKSTYATFQLTPPDTAATTSLAFDPAATLNITHIMMKCFAVVLVVLLTVWETEAFAGNTLFPRAAAGRHQQRRGATTVKMVSERGSDVVREVLSAPWRL